MAEPLHGTYWARPKGETRWAERKHFWRSGPDIREHGMEYLKIGTVAVDLLGQELVVGDKIAAAMTAGRSADLAIGTIVGFIVQSGWEKDNLLWIDVEWETRTHHQGVKRSKIDASLPKFVKL